MLSLIHSYASGWSCIHENHAMCSCVPCWRQQQQSQSSDTSERDLRSCEVTSKAYKKILRLQRDSNPWPPQYRCDALPTELWSLAGSRSGASSIYTCYVKRMISFTYILYPQFTHMIFIICTISKSSKLERTWKSICMRTGIFHVYVCVFTLWLFRRSSDHTWNLRQVEISDFRNLALAIVLVRTWPRSESWQVWRNLAVDIFSGGYCGSDNLMNLNIYLLVIAIKCVKMCVVP